MTPQSLRAWITVVMRDLLIPGAGLVLTFYLPIAERFEYWQIPLLLGMMGLPVVARGEAGEQAPPNGPEGLPGVVPLEKLDPPMGPGDAPQ